MASLSEIMAARQNAATSLATPVLPKTKLEEKKERLFGNQGGSQPEPSQPASTPEGDGRSLLDFMGSGSSGQDASLVDLGQASLYRAGGNLADMGKSVSNAVFGSEFDDSADTGWSRPADAEQGVASAADQMAGITFDQRQNENEQLQGVMNDWVEGDYLGALGGALRSAPALAADSAASMVELGAGALLTPVAGAGGALLAKKAKNIYDTIGKIGDSYDAAKDAQRVARASTMLERGIANAARGSSQASILTADIVQQTKVEYEQETGEEMSPARLFGTTALTLATTAWQPEIVKRFYLPNVRTPAGRTAKEKFDNEVRRMVEYADRGMARSIANRIGAGAGKVFQAGGAEAVQEYAQTWAGILSVKMDPEEAGGLFQAAWEEFSDEDNQNEAEVAGLLGAAAGGTIRAATAAPSVATGSVADVGVKGAQAVGRRVQESARVNLSDEDQRILDDEITGVRAANTEVKNENSRKAAIVGESSSFDQIQDEAVREDFTTAAKGRDLSDPRVYKLVSDRLTRAYGADSAKSEVATRVKSGYATGKAKTKQAIRDLPISEATKETVARKAREVVQGTKDMSASFVDDISNFKTSTTLGVAEAAVDFVADTAKTSSRQATKTLNEKLRKVGTAEAARSVANKISESAPLTARELNRWADGQEASRKKTGLKTDRFVNYESLGDSIKQSSQPNAKVTSPLALAQDLREVAKGSIENMDTVRAVENALANYEATDYHKTGKEESGKLAPATIKNIRRKVEARKAELESKVSKTDQAKEAAGKVASMVKEKTGPVLEKVKKMTAASAEYTVDKLVNEDVFVAKDSPAQRNFLSTLKNQVNGILENPKTTEETDAKADDKQVADARIATAMDMMLDDQTLKNISRAFNTSNRDFVASVVERIFPAARSREFNSTLMEAIDKALEGSNRPNTEPERRRKETKKPAESKDSDSEVVIEEDGAVFKRKPDETVVRSAMEKLMGSINICKV